jgi:hypothetical protein
MISAFWATPVILQVRRQYRY